MVAIDIDIEVKEINGGRQIAWWPQFRVIDTAEVTPDPDVAAVVRGFEAELTRELDVPLAITRGELDSRDATVRSREAAIGDLIADAMRDSTGADAAVINGGGIRAGKLYAPGTAITRRDILAELPFGNRVVRLTIPGRALRAAIENGLSHCRRVPAGFRRSLDWQSRPTSRGRPAADIVHQGRRQPARRDKTYSVATNDFLARGGDGYVQFRDAPGRCRTTTRRCWRTK